jgi:predicted amidophosphoribosyltransferase
MPDSNAIRQARFRWRRKQGITWQPDLCEACGKPARKLLCSRCWTSLTPAGRADRAARVANAKARQRAQSNQTPITILP